ncbi:hypothetical protein ACVGXS_12835, partial [Enterobacter hormaechei]
EGASRRFRAVMMTAVSFIIGVLGLFVGPRGGGPSPPIKATKLFSGMLVGTVVWVFIIKKKHTTTKHN